VGHGEHDPRELQRRSRRGPRGKFKITNAAAGRHHRPWRTGTDARLADVIAKINGRNIGVTASINANGDGCC
jgi:hypothetical protein